MPEEVKNCAERVAGLFNSVSPDKREMATVIAEAFATGLSIGAELSVEGKPEKELE